MKSDILTIEKIINGGYGIARNGDGEVVLLHNSLPGEEVRYRVVGRRRKTLFGIAEPVSNIHPNRVDPPCKYYEKCGGCNLQHCSYDEQIKIKTAITAELFSKLLSEPGSCIPSPKSFGYRQRIRLQVRDGKVGFLRFRSNELVPVTSCLLACAQINKVLEYLLKEEHFTGLCANSREVELLHNPKSDQVILLFHQTRPPRPAERNLAITLVEECGEIERVFFIGENFSLQDPFPENPEEKGSRLLCDHYQNTTAEKPFQLCWEVGGFCQVNPLQNAKIINYVLDRSRDLNKAKILDLCCGMGNFSIPLALSASAVVGVESQAAAVRAARKNSSNAGISNSTFIKGDIATVCKKLIEEKQLFGLTVIDPPRQGAIGLGSEIAQLTSRRILYISCDPATLVRDITNLQQFGFQLVAVQPFDMFPQTHHIEVVAVLEKN